MMECAGLKWMHLVGNWFQSEQALESLWVVSMDIGSMLSLSTEMLILNLLKLLWSVVLSSFLNLFWVRLTKLLLYDNISLDTVNNCDTFVMQLSNWSGLLHCINSIGDYLNRICESLSSDVKSELWLNQSVKFGQITCSTFAAAQFKKPSPGISSRLR